MQPRALGLRRTSFRASDFHPRASHFPREVVKNRASRSLQCRTRELIGKPKMLVKARHHDGRLRRFKNYRLVLVGDRRVFSGIRCRFVELGELLDRRIYDLVTGGRADERTARRLGFGPCLAPPSRRFDLRVQER